MHPHSASFSTLPIEVKEKIWKLTFPASRIIRVILAQQDSEKPASSSQTSALKSAESTLESKLNTVLSLSPTSEGQKYKTLVASWGGIFPQVLHTDRVSRALALRHFTERFDCYWNFDVDIVYVELPFLGHIDAANKQLYDMRLQGLLDGVKHLAVDWEMWDNGFRAFTEEHW